jgi:hypothetical protein
MPLQNPSFPQVDVAASAHCISGSIPAGTLVHVPALPGNPHDLQVPMQSVEQQTPCAQMLELHSALSPQVPPSGFFPQLPPTQVLGATQSASTVQVSRHWPLAPHWKGAQDWAAGAAQVPVPSQRPAEVSVELVQPAWTHTVPAEYSWQAPAPSHCPVSRQLSAPVSWHIFRGLLPTSAGTQVPKAPVAVHV